MNALHTHVTHNLVVYNVFDFIGRVVWNSFAFTVAIAATVAVRDMNVSVYVYGFLIKFLYTFILCTILLPISVEKKNVCIKYAGR